MTTRSCLPLIVNMHPSGQHPSAWRLDHVNPRRSSTSTTTARSPARPSAGSSTRLLGRLLGPAARNRPPAALDDGPVITMSALAAETEHLGLVASVSTTLAQPYQVARAIASLDHVSRGRAGWNVVTSYDPNAGRNYGLDDLPDKRDRYRRAAEHIEVVEALWSSWEDGALVPRPRDGRVRRHGAGAADRAPGEFFDVAGPLQVPPPPQGRPVVFQAGASEGGRAVAARYTRTASSARSSRSNGPRTTAATCARGRAGSGRAGTTSASSPASSSSSPRATRRRAEAARARRARGRPRGAPGHARARLGISFDTVAHDRPLDPAVIAEIEGRGDRTASSRPPSATSPTPPTPSGTSSTPPARAPDARSGIRARWPTPSRSGSTRAPPTASSSCSTCCPTGCATSSTSVDPRAPTPRALPHRLRGAHAGRASRAARPPARRARA